MIRRYLFCLVAFTLPLVTQGAAASNLTAVKETPGDLLPLQVLSRHDGNRYSGSVTAVLDFPYLRVVDALRSGANWCDIAPLHFNVKACTFEENTQRLTFYSGRKYYQTPENARPFAFQYEVRTDRPDSFEARFVPDAAARTFGSEPIVLLARPQPGGRTSIRVLFGYRETWLTRLATEGYFATVGQGKKGFTIKGSDADGQPVHVDGIVGAIERNATRYYFALTAFLATRNVPAREGFEHRINRWFDLTDQYRAQLYEMEKDVYLAQKRRERNEQIRVQRLLDLHLIAGENGQRG